MLEVIREEVVAVLGKESSAKVDTANWFMDGLVDARDRRVANQVQSLHIKVGKITERVSNRLVDLNPRLARPAPLWGPGVDETTDLPQPQEPFVASRLPKDKVNELADRVKETYIALPRDSDRTRTLHRLIRGAQRELAQISATRLDREVQLYYVDLAYNEVRADKSVKALVLQEVKSSGKLDSKNVPDELRNLLKGVLALGSYPVPIKPMGGCAFGDGNNPFAKKFGEAICPSGDAYWARLLPDGLTPADFKQAWIEATAPYKLRR